MHVRKRKSYFLLNVGSATYRTGKNEENASRLLDYNDCEQSHINLQETALKSPHRMICALHKRLCFILYLSVGRKWFGVEDEEKHIYNRINGGINQADQSQIATLRKSNTDA